MSEDRPMDVPMVVQELQGQVKKLQERLRLLEAQQQRSQAAAVFNEERISVWRERYEKAIDLFEEALNKKITRQSKIYKSYLSLIKEVSHECET